MHRLPRRLVPGQARSTLEIVKRTDDMEGFVVLPRRWVAERTFACFAGKPHFDRSVQSMLPTATPFGAKLARRVVRY